MQAPPDRPWSRRSRIGQFYTFDPIQAARRFDDDGFHGDLQFKAMRMRTAKCKLLKRKTCTYTAANSVTSYWPSAALELTR